MLVQPEVRSTTSGGEAAPRTRPGLGSMGSCNVLCPEVGDPGGRQGALGEVEGNAGVGPFKNYPISPGSWHMSYDYHIHSCTLFNLLVYTFCAIVLGLQVAHVNELR